MLEKIKEIGLVLFLISSVSLAGAMIPYAIRNIKKYGEIYSLTSVLILVTNMSVAFVDMMPELNHHAAGCVESRKLFIIAGATIIALMFIESLVILDHNHEVHSHESHGTEKHEADHFHQCHMHELQKNQSFLKTLIFVIAISVHSFLEGLDLELNHLFPIVVMCLH